MEVWGWELRMEAQNTSRLGLEDVTINSFLQITNTQTTEHNVYFSKRKTAITAIYQLFNNIVGICK